MKEQIKELRVKIDGISQLVKELRPNSESVNWRAFHTKETEKAYDSLIIAKAWLGKVLGELGEETPYTNDGNRKTVEDIEPTADKHTLLGDTMSDFNLQFCNPDGTTPSISWTNKKHIEKVDWLRQEIGAVVKIVNQIGQGNKLATNIFTREFSIARTNSYNHLCEARFWLGFELQRIKEENEKQD